ncbi:MAG: FliH/SctL family protein [Phycisphaeraceae bacterium]
MALIKSENAGSLVKEAVVLDLGDIGRQAAKIRENAERQAAETLEQARQEAERLTSGAEAIGLERGRQAGLEQGLEEGRQQGHAEALEAMQPRFQQLAARLTEAAGQLEQQRKQLDSEASQAVLQFAVAMAEKIVARAIEVEPGRVVDQVVSALGHVLRPLDVKVAIHPEDRPLVEEAMPELVRDFDHLQHIELVADESVGRGGCVVNYGQGRIDATIDTQLGRIVETLLPTGDVEPAGDEI